MFGNAKLTTENDPNIKKLNTYTLNSWMFKLGFKAEKSELKHYSTIVLAVFRSRWIAVLTVTAAEVLLKANKYKNCEKNTIRKFKTIFVKYLKT